jgi:hypothetical protein
VRALMGNCGFSFVYRYVQLCAANCRNTSRSYDLSIKDIFVINQLDVNYQRLGLAGDLHTPVCGISPLRRRDTLRSSVSGFSLTNHFTLLDAHAKLSDPLNGVFFWEYDLRRFGRILMGCSEHAQGTDAEQE